MGNRMQFYVTWWPKEGHKPPGRRQRIELNADIGALVELARGGLGAGGFSMGVSEGSCSNSFGLGELARFVVAVLRYQYADLRSKSSLHDAIQHVLDGKREQHEAERCAVKKPKHDHNREANCLPIASKECDVKEEKGPRKRTWDEYYREFDDLVAWSKRELGWPID